MRTKLDRLTPEQSRRLAEYRNRWSAVAASTAPVDRAAAVAGVCAAYEVAGLRPPRQFVWCNGPYSLSRDWMEAATRGSAGENVRHLIVDKILTRTVSRIDSSVSFGVRGLVTNGARLPSPISDAANHVIIASVADIRSSLWARLRRLSLGLGGRRGPKPRSFRESSWGQHDIAWMPVAEFFRDVCGLAAETEDLRGLWAVARNIGWMVPHADVCWLSERHNVLHTDQNGRLHSQKGPAIKYPDNWSAYFWKGIELPSWMIEHPGSITPDLIRRHPDRVMRRCMIEIMTPEKYIARCGVAPSARDETGTLWRVNLYGGDVWAAVQVANGTPEPDGTRKYYYLQVPAHMRSAREAVAWTYGMSAKEYSALQLRT